MGGLGLGWGRSRGAVGLFLIYCTFASGMFGAH